MKRSHSATSAYAAISNEISSRPHGNDAMFAAAAPSSSHWVKVMRAYGTFEFILISRFLVDAIAAVVFMHLTMYELPNFLSIDALIVFV